MSLTRWNPYDPFDEMDQTMNRMMDRMRSMMRSRFGSGDEEGGANFDANPLAIDMTSNENDIVVRTAPGSERFRFRVDLVRRWIARNPQLGDTVGLPGRPISQPQRHQGTKTPEV